MPWDSKRTIPWKRLGVLLAVYAGLMLAVSAISRKSNFGAAAGSVAIGVVVAGGFLIVLAKFGYTLPILRSREQLAAERAARLEARQQARGGTDRDSVPGPRPKPAPTKRTSTGPSQNPRRSSSGRKR